jgi:hypothetical protein
LLLTEVVSRRPSLAAVRESESEVDQPVPDSSCRKLTKKRDGLSPNACDPVDRYQRGMLKSTDRRPRAINSRRCSEPATPLRRGSDMFVQAGRRCGLLPAGGKLTAGKAGPAKVVPLRSICPKLIGAGAAAAHASPPDSGQALQGRRCHSRRASVDLVGSCFICDPHQPSPLLRLPVHKLVYTHVDSRLLFGRRRV